MTSAAKGSRTQGPKLNHQPHHPSVPVVRPFRIREPTDLADAALRHAGPHRVNVNGYPVVLASRMPVRAAILDDDELATGCLQREVTAARVL